MPSIDLSALPVFVVAVVMVTEQKMLSYVITPDKLRLSHGPRSGVRVTLNFMLTIDPSLAYVRHGVYIPGISSVEKFD